MMTWPGKRLGSISTKTIGEVYVPKSSEGETFTLTLHAVPHDVPAILRLRRLLKYALRGCAMQCVQIRAETEPETEKDQ